MLPPPLSRAQVNLVFEPCKIKPIDRSYSFFEWLQKWIMKIEGKTAKNEKGIFFKYIMRSDVR